MPAAHLRGKTIVVTGVTGQVAEPVALALAGENEVVGAARFTDPAARVRLEEAGVRCVPIDLAAGDVGGLPRDADYVVNFAVSKTNDWNLDLQANSGGLAWLMEHHQDATAFLHCSTTGVYKPHGPPRLRRGGPAGRQPRRVALPPHLQHLQDRRRGHRPVGGPAFRPPHHRGPAVGSLRDRGGWPAIHLEMMINGSEIPVHLDAPSVYHPLHQDDIIAMVPGLLGAATTPATTVNWGGDDAVSIEEWCGTSPS